MHYYSHHANHKDCPNKTGSIKTVLWKYFDPLSNFGLPSLPSDQLYLRLLTERSITTTVKIGTVVVHMLVFTFTGLVRV